MARARSGGGRRGVGGGSGGDGDGGWTPSPAFLEQPLEKESTPFFLQMTARVCGEVYSPLIEPIMGREGKGPTRGPQPTPNMLIERNKVHKEGWASRMGSREGKNPPGTLKGREEINEDPLKHVRVKNS